MLECVPNFSEGRRPDIIDAIVSSARSIESITVLDVHADSDHNRSVLTLAGERAPLVEAVYRAVARATELIDLRLHTGEHPRLGATDVVPFIPLGPTTMHEAVDAARELGERIARDLHIPVYFYEEAATRPARRNLETIRSGGFEELLTAVENDPARAPDLGPPSLHPSAGAAVVGARGPLIAFNIYLDTSDIRIAKAIAKVIRHSSGGFRYVKALGIDVPAQGRVQVSMNLTNFQKTAMHTVFAAVQTEAAAFGVNVTHSEVVGLIPMDAMLDAACYALRLRPFDRQQVLETKMLANE